MEPGIGAGVSLRGGQVIFRGRQDGGVPMCFFHGCIIALKIEAAAVFSAWFAVRLWQIFA